jgi:biopolymer transport protein ExbD
MNDARFAGGLRRRNALHIWENRFGPNMTPMVDVVLVILIFFMAGTTFLGQEWFLKSEFLKKGGAAAKAADPLALPPVWLTIALDVDQSTGQTRASGLGAGATDLAGFAKRLADFAAGTETKQIVVVLSPSADVPYKDVVKAHEACAAAGIERVGIGAPDR